MKNLVNLFLAVFAIAFMSCQGQQEKSSGLSVEASIAGSNGQAILNKLDGRNLSPIDTADIKDGKFTFSNVDVEPAICVIKIGENSFVDFFMESGTIKIDGKSDDLDNVSVVGGPDNVLWGEFSKMNKDFQKASQEMGMKFQSADSLAKLSIRQEYEDAEKAFVGKIGDLAKKNNKAVASLFIVTNYLQTTLSFDELKAITEGIDASLHENDLYKKLKADVDALTNVQIGKKAPDFTMNDINGAPVSLSSLTGKGYLLVDFWAAWCRPCRAENPNVVAAYAKFHEKGFDILGVSFDKTAEDWKKAVEADGLTWTQVSDLLFWDNAAGKLYGVKSIPHNVLLDKEGVIIAKDLRGEDLSAKLAELLGE